MKLNGKNLLLRVIRGKGPCTGPSEMITYGQAVIFSLGGAMELSPIELESNARQVTKRRRLAALLSGLLKSLEQCGHHPAF